MPVYDIFEIRWAGTEDLTGQIIGRWTVLRFAGSVKGATYWTCQCSCPKRTIRDVSGQSLRRAREGKKNGSMSCRCLQREVQRALQTTHNMSESPEFWHWTYMLGRCLNPNDTNYPFYGGRGITVCDRWRTSFEAFYADMGPRPSNNHSLDRYPDPNGPYAPGNTRWATRHEQSRNRRHHRMITYHDETLCLMDWAIKLDKPYNTLYSRLSRNWSVERAFETPVQKNP